MIARVWALTWAGVLQLARSRVYLNILVAGIGLVLAALAFDRLAGGEGGRVLFDVGTAFIALVVAALSGIIAITGVTRELETKQAHLVLSRPTSRSEFVIARFLTTALLVVVSNLALGVLLAGMLAYVEAPHAGLAFAVVLFASFEGFIVAAIATFFGVGSSSTMCAIFTTTFFVLGRLTGELQTVIDQKSFGDATGALTVIQRVLPHLPAFDLTKAATDATAFDDIWGIAAYGVCYTAAFLCAAVVRFSKKDLM